jgi:hypothetical protein
MFLLVKWSYAVFVLLPPWIGLACLYGFFGRGGAALLQRLPPMLAWHLSLSDDRRN